MLTWSAKLIGYHIVSTALSLLSQHLHAHYNLVVPRTQLFTVALHLSFLQTVGKLVPSTLTITNMRFLSITGVTCKENSLPKTHTCGGCHFGILESLHSNHTKAGVVAQAVHGGQVSGLVDASALVPRDNICPEVPKLCTGHAVMQGKATTLTYVCPTEVPGPSTVHVTVTATTTVYVVPTKTASATSIPGE